MVKFSLMAAAVVTLLGCGGAGSGTGGYSLSAPGTTGNVGAYEGPWTGTLTSTTNGPVTARVLILASGEMRYVAANGIQAVGTLSAVKTAVSASGTLYAATGYTFPSGSSTSSFTFSGTGGTSDLGPTITGTYSGGGDSGTFQFSYDNSATYSTPVVLANVAGAYTSVITSTGTTITGRLASDGSLTGTDAYGSLTGQLTVVDATKNAFRITATYTQTGLTSENYSGLAYFESGTTPLHLYLQATGSNSQFAADIERTGP